MVRRLYDWMMALAADRRALWWLAGISFVESSFFPIPPDIMLIPMILAQPRRAFLIAAVCTAASVLGGFLGYAIGYWLLEGIGRPVLEFYGQTKNLEAFQAMFREYGWWIIVIKGATPIPYKLITIASGAAHFPLVSFAVASVISRGLRFFLVAALLWKFGPPIRTFVEQRLTLVTTVFVVLLVGGFVAAKVLL
ncbi:MAG: DedA family protein [Alphaproteobacteria bacterium]|nr:DedA family protein [Alphaproteobacteria bacterium]